jgi:hypothetical protein
MIMRVLSGMAVIAGAAAASGAAMAYMAPSPVLIPPAFQRPMSPLAHCAAQAQDQFLSGPAYDFFVENCTQAAVANICDKAAADRRLTGKRRTAFTEKCAQDIEQAQR